MNQIIIPWKRFWIHRDGSLNFDRDGYPYDPENEDLRWYHKGVVSFDEITNKPCIVLLGEPGIGKTIAAKTEIGKIESQTDGIKNKVFYKDLSEYKDETRLIEEIFDANIKKARINVYRLFLFLDSFDECQFMIPNIASLIFTKAVISKPT